MRNATPPAVEHVSGFLPDSVGRRDPPYILRLRKSDRKLIFNVKNPRHLTYWVKQPVDVYLVIRDGEGVIRWMNITQYLKTRKNKKSRQIVFEGEKLTDTALWYLCDDYIPRGIT